MNTSRLKKWAKEQKLEERAKDYFWAYMNGLMDEEPEQFQEAFGQYNWQRVQVEYSQISMSVSFKYEEPLDFIGVYLDVFQLDHEEEEIFIGIYKCFFDFEGQHLNEFFSA